MSLPQILLRRFDGSTFWARLEANLTRDDSRNVRWIDGVLMDVTPLVTAEREQARTTAILSTLIDHLPEGIALVDEDWNVMMCNPKAESMLASLGYRKGLPLVMLAGKPISQFLRPSPRGCGTNFLLMTELTKSLSTLPPISTEF